MAKQAGAWVESAERFLTGTFLPRTQGQAFLAEQFRAACVKAGVPVPEGLHEWGAFFRRMQRAGHLRRTGFGLDRHGSPKSLWRTA